MCPKLFFPKKKKRRLKDDGDKDKVILTHSFTHFWEHSHLKVEVFISFSHGNKCQIFLSS